MESTVGECARLMWPRKDETGKKDVKSQVDIKNWKVRFVSDALERIFEATWKNF